MTVDQAVSRTPVPNAGEGGWRHRRVRGRRARACRARGCRARRRRVETRRGPVVAPSWPWPSSPESRTQFMRWVRRNGSAFWTCWMLLFGRCFFRGGRNDDHGRCCSPTVTTTTSTDRACERSRGGGQRAVCGASRASGRPAERVSAPGGAELVARRGGARRASAAGPRATLASTARVHEPRTSRICGATAGDAALSRRNGAGAGGPNGACAPCGAPVPRRWMMPAPSRHPEPPYQL